MALNIRRQGRGRLIVAAVLAGIAILALYNALSNGARNAPSAAPAARTVPIAPSLPAPQKPRARARVAPTQPADPDLKVDLLGKSAGVTYEAGGRNIFAYYTPPPPPPPKPVANPLIGKSGGEGGPGAPATPPAPPPPPPIPLKYYGYAHKPTETQKKAFLAEGEDIYIAAEGDIVNKKYKIVKIGVNTVEAEDLTTKHRQLLPLQETP